MIDRIDRDVSTRIDKALADMGARQVLLEEEIRKLKRKNAREARSVAVVSTPTAVSHPDIVNVGPNQHHAESHANRHKVVGADPLFLDGLRFDSITQYNGIADDGVFVEGEIWWNTEDHTLNIQLDTETIIQVGLEQATRIINKTGGQLANGTVVYIDGADVATARATVTKADASTWEDSQKTIGLMTSTVEDDAQGYVTRDGLVRGLDTSGETAGDMVYLSETVGEWTTTRPTQPAYIIEIGKIHKVDASDGEILVKVDNTRDYGYFNGTFVETFDFLITSDGADITGSLLRTGGGNLTMRFGTGPFSTLVTPPMTIALTPGTATVPKVNYLYILQSDQTQITKSLSGYPTDVAHIKISKVVVLTAGITQTDGGALANQNRNDHAVDTILMGHSVHTGDWVRAQPSTYEPPGIAGNSSTGDVYLEITTVPDAVHVKSTAGNVRQFHLQAFPAMDTSGSDFIYVINDPDAAYTKVTELIAGIDKLSDGTLIGNNKYFGIVLLGIANKTGEIQMLMCNLPAGQYNSQGGAENDLSGFSNFTIPDEFLSTGFLICKIVAQLVGSTWVHKSTKDLRGLTPAILIGGGGAGGGTVVEFPDNTHRIHDEADPTKEIAHDAGSLISTGNIRTIIMPDEDVTLFNLIDEDDMSSDDATKAPSQQSTKAYVDGHTEDVIKISPQLWDTSNGAQVISVGSHNAWQIPALDSNAQLNFNFKIPDEWTADKCTIVVRYSIDDANAFLVRWRVTSLSTGDTHANQQSNIHSASGIFDFPAGNADELYDRSVPIDDTDFDIGDILQVRIIADGAANSGNLAIYAIWIEGS